ILSWIKFDVECTEKSFGIVAFDASSLIVFEAGGKRGRKLLQAKTGPEPINGTSNSDGSSVTSAREARFAGLGQEGNLPVAHGLRKGTMCLAKLKEFSQSIQCRVRKEVARADGLEMSREGDPHLWTYGAQAGRGPQAVNGDGTSIVTGNSLKHSSIALQGLWPQTTVHVDIPIHPENPRPTFQKTGGLGSLIEDRQVSIWRPVSGQHTETALEAMQLCDQQLALVGGRLLEDLQGQRALNENSHATFPAEVQAVTVPGRLIVRPHAQRQRSRQGGFADPHSTQAASGESGSASYA
ncbi:unnamed protein product, partial [Symbiodinium sp. KB8]